MEDANALCRFSAGLFLSFGVLVSQALPASTGPTLDDASRQCLGCHDGVAAADVVLHSSTPSAASHESRHGIGMSYATIAQSMPAEFRQPHELDRRITLVDGRISCVSCHGRRNNSADGDASPGVQPMMSVLENQCMVLAPGLSQNNNLCLGCHYQ